MTRRRSDATSTEEFTERRLAMVEQQLRRRGISDERVLHAMEQVPRELFVPEEERRRAYRDGALRIGEGQTISQPWIVAAMTALLELEPGDRALEIGTGSGYAAAVLSLCCREVVTIERHPSLAEHARELLAQIGRENVEVRAGDGSRGAPDRAPFDGISVTATAHERPPQLLLEQLAPGGVLLCPVRTSAGERLTRYRAGGGVEPLVEVRFVPLVEDADGGD